MTQDPIKLRYPVNSLASFHYFKSKDIAEMQGWGLRLIGDSGAYSAETQGKPIDIEAFIRWGHKWKENLAWLASLDVIGDKDGSWDNYKYLKSQDLDIIPTIHYGCDPKELDRYVDDGVNFLGLGGMVSKKSESQRLLRWTLAVFKYARDNFPDVRFHGWGVTHPQLVLNLPWYSVDSSGFSSAYRFGRLSLFNPKTGKNIGINLDGKEIYQHTELLRKVYNCDPDEVAISNTHTRRQLVRLSVASVQQMENFLRHRHNVSPPSYGVNPKVEVAGPHIHVAGSAEKDFNSMGRTVGPSVHFVDTYIGHLKMTQDL